jgi:hypothetical protein
MRLAVTAALPNAIVFVMDYEFGELPESMGGRRIAAKPTCIVVGTLHEQFGNTELVLTDQIDEIDQTNMHVIFDGHIECPSGELSLVSALDEKLISMPLKSTHVRVRVFVNDDIEPDRVAILVG